MSVDIRNMKSAWFANVQTQRDATLRLFCFPYAGGNTGIFHNWSHDLPFAVEIYPVQLPGRMQRTRESLITSMDQLIPALEEAILPVLDRNFAFYGHSMGALIAFELARTLMAKHGLEPKHLLVSGRKAPQLVDNISATQGLSDEEFIQHVRRLNGTPAKVFDNPEMLHFLLPVLRADFELVQSHRFRDGQKLSCPIKAFGGLSDQHVPKNSILPWGQTTTGKFSVAMMPGDHFFIQNSRRQFLALLSAELQAVIQVLKNRQYSANLASR